MTSPSPVGLHRVLEPVGVLPQAAWRLDADPAIGADEVRVRRRAAQPRRRELPPAGREARAGTGTPCAPRSSRSSPSRGKMQNPVTGSRRHARRRRRRGRPGLAARPRGRGPGRHPRLAVADPAAHHRRAGPLGRSLRAGPVRRHRDPVRPLDRRRAARRPARRARPRRHGRLRRAGAHRARSSSGYVAARAGADGRRPRRSRQVRLALPGRGPARRCAPHGRRRPDRAPSAELLDGQRARRRRRPRRRARPGRPVRRRDRRAGRARPTSPSSASTYPAASTARSWPPTRAAARSSSSRWRRRSPPPPWAPRASPPT